ncbi:MAG: ester cyclase [Albidovulum sp.]|nr:ester cyclase [Albidovulum sp.]
MSAERNLRLVQSMYEALNRQDIDAHDEFWHRDMIWHGPPGFGSIHGLDGFKNEVLRPFYRAFPDYRAKNDIEFADENWVAATGFVTGTQSGPYLGFPPSGKKMRMRFSDFWSVRDGKLSENWVMIDHVDVFRQLGYDMMANLPGRSE